MSPPRGHKYWRKTLLFALRSDEKMVNMSCLLFDFVHGYDIIGRIKVTDHLAFAMFSDSDGKKVSKYC